jgi:lipoate-protein ligase A
VGSLATVSALHVIDTGYGEPSRNMALDEALLRDGQGSLLRFYGWQPHAVSLGRFQREADFADVALHTPVVRRATGGGAIHHAHELTYALTIDAASFPADLAASYALVHDAFVAALARHDVRCHRMQEGRQAGARPIERWCFAEPGAGDVVDDAGRKLLGSAQRRIRLPRERVLQHGSLVLRPAPHTPFTAAVCHQADPDAMLASLKGTVADLLAHALGLDAWRAVRSDELGVVLP